ncbi:MAG: hypothetical protein ACHRHE_07965 [Tepidisphaerales bacterium]
MSLTEPTSVPRCRILIVSPQQGVMEQIEGRLEHLNCDAVWVRSGPEFLRSVRDMAPSVAVIDRVHERAEAARMEIALLKELCPDARIIVISEEPSAEDAWVSEQGVFYYMTLAPGPELVRVIEAAARSHQTTRSHGTSRPAPSLERNP